ncbi:MAG: DNRLRE domain-containing protein [Polyangiaceae bacterium]|nr:DNRLRE domain-containing protein [Polyangiaceae bacterium]
MSHQRILSSFVIAGLMSALIAACGHDDDDDSTNTGGAGGAAMGGTGARTGGTAGTGGSATGGEAGAAEETGGTAGAPAATGGSPPTGGSAGAATGGSGDVGGAVTGGSPPTGGSAGAATGGSPPAGGSAGEATSGGTAGTGGQNVGGAAGSVAETGGTAGSAGSPPTVTGGAGGAGGAVVGPDSATIEISEDTSVHENGNASLEDAQTLVADRDDTDLQPPGETLFLVRPAAADVAALADATIELAELVLTAFVDAEDGTDDFDTLELYAITNEWASAEVEFGELAALVGENPIATLPGTEDNTVEDGDGFRIDVTELVRSWVEDGAAYGILVRMVEGGDNGADFYSSDADAGAPRIEIVLGD